jgi:hypothetical protein
MMTADEPVVAITKQTGWDDELGHTIWFNELLFGMLSVVQVTLDPDTVAVSRTPPEPPEPMTTHAGVVAPDGHTMSSSWETPEGRLLFDHEVPLVVTAAAPPDVP